MYSYDRRKEARLVAPDALFRLMKDSVESLLKTRVTIRTLWDVLDSINEDATGVHYTNNYNDPMTRGTSKQLYDLDHAIGEVYPNIEYLEKEFRRNRVKK